MAPRSATPPQASRPKTFLGHIYDVQALAYSPDGARLAVGSNDGSVYVWDPVASHLLHQIHSGRDTITALAYSPDGTRLAACDGEAVQV